MKFFSFISSYALYGYFIILPQKNKPSNITKYDRNEYALFKIYKIGINRY